MDTIDLIKEIKFNENGLAPAIVQDFYTKQVLMLAYMNEESIKKTIETKYAYFFSRSRNELWKKGETSGNLQGLISFSYDCDKDTILLQVKQNGVACHTGSLSCFYNKVISEKEENNIIEDLYSLILDRKLSPKENFYTNYLFDKGIDKILKKVGEEISEVIIASKNKDKNEIIYELSDLTYHVLVLMIESNINLSDIKEELSKRWS